MQKGHHHSTFSPVCGNGPDSRLQKTRQQKPKSRRTFSDYFSDSSLNICYILYIDVYKGGIILGNTAH